MITTNLGGLTCRITGPGSPRLAVILCHGFGAPGDDLVPFAEHLVLASPALADVRFVFPAAPLDLSVLGMPGARAWWHIDFPALERAVRGGPEALAAYRRQTPPGLAEARRALHGLVDAVCTSSGLPLSRVILGGFSQGAMLATDLTLRLEEAPAALAILSGAPVAQAEWEKRAPARAGLRVLQSHGRQDAVLPFVFGEALRELLAGAGLLVDFAVFDGGHEIPLPVLRRLAALITSCAGSPGVP